MTACPNRASGETPAQHPPRDAYAGGVTRPFLVYNAWRFGLFLAAAGLVWAGTGAAGNPLNGFPLLVVALLLSSIASFVLLREQRDAVGLALEQRRLGKREEEADLRRALDETDGPAA